MQRCARAAACSHTCRQGSVPLPCSPTAAVCSAVCWLLSMPILVSHTRCAATGCYRMLWCCCWVQGAWQCFVVVLVARVGALVGTLMQGSCWCAVCTTGAGRSCCLPCQASASAGALLLVVARVGMLLQTCSCCAAPVPAAGRSPSSVAGSSSCCLPCQTSASHPAGAPRVLLVVGPLLQGCCCWCAAPATTAAHGRMLWCCCWVQGVWQCFVMPGLLVVVQVGTLLQGCCCWCAAPAPAAVRSPSSMCQASVGHPAEAPPVLLLVARVGQLLQGC